MSNVEDMIGAVLGRPNHPDVERLAAIARDLDESVHRGGADDAEARGQVERVERLIDPATEFATVNDGRQRLFDESDIRAALAGQEGAS